MNGDVESWQNMWPKLAKKFRCHIPRNQFRVDVGKDADSVMPLAEKPPLADVAAEIGLENNSERSQVEQKIDLVRWSQRDDVKKAWEKLSQEQGLDKDTFGKATWGFLGFVLGRNYNVVISMSKARRFGWTGLVFFTFVMLVDVVNVELLTMRVAISILGTHWRNVWTNWRRKRYYPP